MSSVHFRDKYQKSSNILILEFSGLFIIQFEILKLLSCDTGRIVTYVLLLNKK